jgi:phage terminase large subunit-like protein
MGNVIIDNNPITRWCFNNAALKVDYNQNCKPIKAFTENNKIDGVISMIQALGIYLGIPHYTALV